MLFASDLDNTLIHSYKTYNTGDVCVELKDGKEMSFMNPKAFSLLKEISEQCVFIPVTTRSLEQYLRIDFGLTPKYAVVAHGALLLIDGKIDEQWACETRGMLNIRLPEVGECELLYDIRYVENFFIFAKSGKPREAAEYLRSFIDMSRFTVCAAHNKVYIFPNGLNKGVAVERLKKLLRVETVICAGDSELDIPMLKVADAAITPGTLELSGAGVRIVNGDSFAYSALCAVKDFLGGQ